MSERSKRVSVELRAEQVSAELRREARKSTEPTGKAQAKGVNVEAIMVLRIPDRKMASL